MIGFSRRDGRVMRDQSHLDRNLPGRRIGVGTHQEEPPFFGEPFVIDSFQNPHRIIEMLQHVGQRDIVVAPAQRRGFKGRMHESDLVAKLLPGLLNGRGRTLPRKSRHRSEPGIAW